MNKLFLSLLSSAALLALSHQTHADELAAQIDEQRQLFSTCLSEKSELALAAGVSNERVKQEFSNLKFVPRVIELDRRQPEFISTFPNYYSKRVNAWRIDKGREKYTEYREFLRELTKKYGIPGHYLIAFWGLETNYGGYKGKMSTLDSLATLACDQRRGAFFTKELFLALKLMDRENLVKETMIGSWAGAMGHTQFMPSSYTQYAIDGDGDGVANLWESEKDALTSAAHFLWKLGWTPGLRWGREVILPSDFNYQLANSDKKTVSEWQQIGVTKADSTALGNSDILAKLIVPAGHKGPAFLAYDNFKTILRWNNSEFYGIAVGRLATRITGGGELVAGLPDIPAFSIAEMAVVQRNLNAQGYDVGVADGIMGPATRDGIRRFQTDNKLVADGFPSPETLSLLRSK
ncbi:lytic murein transglycosylase [Agaribacter marinus]|uniref:Lytic transglycosylase n=1 Tax=Agaribacter marinus TaxID=1431249 RepID=A0AA37SYE7_9ALTE|nr:lytic murein transglycosylase [Agaribacter marinus]GLR72282.1 lytic transglycosylase [Agaribacter marinus]